MITAFLAICLCTQGVEEQAQLRGGVWLSRLGGTITDGGGAVDFETNIDLRHKESVPMIEFQVEPIADIVVSLSFFDFATSGSGSYNGNDTYGGMALTNGDLWSASTDLQSVGFEAAWEIWQPYDAGDAAILSFAPIASMRWFGVKTRLENVTTAQEVTHQNSWIALQGGLEMDFRWDVSGSTDFIDAISLSGQVLGGTLVGSDGGFLGSIQTTLSIYFTDSIAGFFGYRLQELNAEDGNYTFDAGLQGLFVGGEIRF
jgi:hypothetical protein